MFFADAHVNKPKEGKTRDGIPVRTWDILKNIDRIVKYVESNQIKYVFFGGDMFDNSVISNRIRALIGKRIKAFSKVATVVLITGNHDIPSSKWSDHALIEYKTLQLPNVYLVDEWKTLNLPDFYLTCIPWVYGGNIYTWQPDLSNDKPNLAIAHCTIAEAVFENGMSPELSNPQDFIISKDWFEPFAWAAAGHIHFPQKVGNIEYPGSVERLTWGELKGDRGFIVGEITDSNVVTEKVILPTRSRIDLHISGYEELPTNIDPDAMYRVTIEAGLEEPVNQMLILNSLKKAFHVKPVIKRPLQHNQRRDKEELSGLADLSPTKQLGVYYKINDLEMDDLTRQLWTEIM